MHRPGRPDSGIGAVPNRLTLLYGGDVMKGALVTFWAILCQGLLFAFGSPTVPLWSMLALMGIDFVLGLIVAAVFGRSSKSESGKLSSQACLHGIIKKACMLIVVIVANILDNVAGVNYARNTVIIAFIINETLSITENCALAGVPIPDVIKNLLDVMKEGQSK